MDFSNLTELIITVLGAGVGGGTLTGAILYQKFNKRIKNAEAISSEVDALRKIVKTLEESIKFEYERRTALEKDLFNRDSYIDIIQKDKHLLEIKHAKNKSCMNKAYSCNGSEKCPVLLEKQRNDEEFAQILLANNKK